MFSIRIPAGFAAGCAKAARRLLAPVGLVYWCVTWVRNRAFDLGWLSTRSFAVPVLCVGNITVGGTGKTPLIEHLLRQLAPSGKVGVVSRGYRRKTKGQVVANASSSTAEDIGDEPRQMLNKFPDTLMVVDANRAAAIDRCVELGARVVLMDDGMQHRHVSPTATIMVCDYARPPYADLPLPAGNLREPWAGKKRARVVVVNKCPADLSEAEADTIRQKMALAPGQELFFSAIGYGEPVLKEGGVAPLDPDTPVVAVAGIGRPEPFFQELEKRFRKVSRVAFADHHSFSETDAEFIRGIVAQASAAAGAESGKNAVIVCTEKDAVRLPKGLAAAVYALPIRVNFLFNQENNFNTIIHSYAH